MKEFVVFVILVLWTAVVSFNSFRAGLHYGRIQVSSGQYVCEIVADDDQTTDWECKEQPQ